MRLLISLLFLFFFTSPSWATTYYIRTDGSNATNCTGLANAAYDGSGTGEACALNHPNWVFPPRTESTAKAAVDGDTVVIGASQSAAQFRIGCQNSVDCRDATINLTQNGYCATTWAYDCYMGVIPNNVTVIGCSIAGCASSSDRPILWGAGSLTRILDVSNASGLTIKDIEITDHSSTSTANGGCAGGASALSAKVGIYGEGNTNSTYTNIKVHGLCSQGWLGGNTGNLTFTNTRFDFNGMAGFDMDTCSNDGTCGVNNNSDYMRFYGTMLNGRYGGSISWNGCAEDWTAEGTPAAGTCREGNNGGFGDGIGGSNTTGQWLFDGMDISHNTSDGLDLLYLNKGTTSGGTLVIQNSRAEGNNGQQIKGSNQISILSSMIIGNCGFFHGKSYTASGFVTCRALGNTITIEFHDDDTSPNIIGNTITGNGDVLIVTAGTCTTGTDNIVKNNIMRGGRQFADDSALFVGGADDSVSIYYDSEVTCDTDFIEQYNICYGFKEGSAACNGTGSTDTVDPLFAGTILQGPYATPGYYTDNNYVDQLDLQVTSTAINAADETVSGALTTDYFKYNRGVSWDIGALEYGSSVSCSPINNICSTGQDCCSGNCSSNNLCFIPGSYLYNITPIGSIKFQ